MTLVKTALLSGVLVAFASGIMLADPIEKKGTTPYVTHFIFRPCRALTFPASARPPCWRRLEPPRT